MFGDLWLALGELKYRAFWGVAALSVVLTLGLFGVLFAGLGWLLGIGGEFSLSLPWIGEAHAPGAVGVLLYGVATVGLSLVLTGPVAALFVGVLLETVVEAVERRRYPEAGRGRPAPLADQIRAGLRLFVTVVAANVALLLVSVLVPPILPVLLVVVNGWLLGREYVETVALRRMPDADARAFRRAHRLRVFGVGAAMASLMAVPVVNLFAPLLGAAAATHLFHRARGGH